MNTIVCRLRVYKKILLLMQNINKAISKVIIKNRQKHSLSQEKLAELVGIHRTYVSQIERGLKSPTLQVLFKLSIAFNISASKLIEEIEGELNVI